ncbi:transporter substrate-binding domain-containing protein [Oscillospiraceae bacterium HV4-5-C5C]|nr:transporter substrate-binding domain-containing protein [Oscillospiraceae bacterium HV4-5-C5C]
MMKKLNLKPKSAALSAAVLLLTAALAACSAGSAATTTAATSTAAAATSAAAAESSLSEAQTSEGTTVITDSAQSETDTKKTVIKAVTGGSPKPYVYVDENNNPTGYDLEVLKAVFEKLPQYELQIDVASFDAVFAGLTSGQYQIGVNNFSWNEKRGESYLYSYPYDKISYVFVNKEGNTPITSFAEAAGKTTEGSTGVSISNAIESWNESNPDQTINLKYADLDTLQQLQHLQDGTTDFQIVDTAMYNAYVKEYGLEGLTASPVSDDDAAKISSSTYAYFLFALDNDELRQEVNTVLKELQADGTLTKLGQEYQDRDDTAPEADQFEQTLN